MTMTHGMRHTRFWGIWRDMKTRCTNPNYRHYADYGGRGITMCDRWLAFEYFKQDLYPDYLLHCERHGERDTFLERMNNNLGYYAGNCCFATRKEQNQNRRMQKLTIEKVREIRATYQHGNGRALAEAFGVTPAVISEIVNKKRNYANRI